MSEKIFSRTEIYLALRLAVKYSSIAFATCLEYLTATRFKSGGTASALQRCDILKSIAAL